jgi:hypothetical protein
MLTDRHAFILKQRTPKTQALRVTSRRTCYSAFTCQDCPASLGLKRKYHRDVFCDETIREISSVIIHSNSSQTALSKAS